MWANERNCRADEADARCAYVAIGRLLIFVAGTRYSWSEHRSAILQILHCDGHRERNPRKQAFPWAREPEHKRLPEWFGKLSTSEKSRRSFSIAASDRQVVFSADKPKRTRRNWPRLFICPFKKYYCLISAETPTNIRHL